MRVFEKQPPVSLFERHVEDRDTKRRKQTPAAPFEGMPVSLFGVLSTWKGHNRLIKPVKMGEMVSLF